MMYGRLAILLGMGAATVGTLAPALAVADDTAPPVRTLLADPGQLAAWLGAHDPAVEAAYAKIEAAEAQAQQAAVLPNPQASLGVGGFVLGGLPPIVVSPTQTIAQPSSFGDTGNFSVGVSELVEIGKRGPRKEGAQLRTHEAGESRVAVLGTQVSNAMTTLGAVAYAYARHEVIVKNLEDSKRVEALETGRRKVGETSNLDLRRIQLDTHELEVQLQRADADLSSALATCSATLFSPCSTAGLDAESLDAAAPVPVALPDPEQAVTSRPTHQAQRIETEALGQDALLAEHRKIPDPTIGVVYDYDAYSGDLSQTLAFSLSIPLPFFDRGNHDAEAARANAHAIEAQDRGAIRQERGSVESLTGKLAALQAALVRLDKELEPTSQAIVNDTQKSLDIGESTITDLLLAERAHRDLLLEVLDTRNDLFTVRAQLRTALGLDDAAARSTGAKR
jgi:cobalt-zinc-cadmium efflux system outer membrane protein